MLLQVFLVLLFLLVVAGIIYYGWAKIVLLGLLIGVPTLFIAGLIWAFINDAKKKQQAALSAESKSGPRNLSADEYRAKQAAETQAIPLAPRHDVVKPMFIRSPGQPATLSLTFGRFMTPDDMTESVVLLADDLASERYATAAAALGKVISLGGQTFEVIGTFHGSHGYDVGGNVLLPVKFAAVFGFDEKSLGSMGEQTQEGQSFARSEPQHKQTRAANDGKIVFELIFQDVVDGNPGEAIEMLSGRYLKSGDATKNVAVIADGLAKKLCGSGPAVGSRVILDTRSGDGTVSIEVIGTFKWRDPDWPEEQRMAMLPIALAPKLGFSEHDIGRVDGRSEKPTSASNVENNRNEYDRELKQLRHIESEYRGDVGYVDLVEPTSVGPLLAELNGLVGLRQVKSEVSRLASFLQVEQLRKSRGFKASDISLHMEFYGNPGTGKTTIARLIAKIYQELGFLSRGHLIEADRAKLVGGYLGQTAIKTSEVIDQALGGVLFIDEAYSLARGDSDLDLYGQEAIETILKNMEDHRNNLVVIVAGYPTEMAAFMSSNPGLKSRFTRFINFEDYSPQELFEIFSRFALSSQYRISSTGADKLRALFENAYRNRDRQFGNGRFVRNLFERSIQQLASRIVTVRHVTDEMLTTIESVDVPDVELVSPTPTKVVPIGFDIPK